MSSIYKQCSVYLFGGCCASSSYKHDLWKLRILNNIATWVNITSNPLPDSWLSDSAYSITWKNIYGNAFVFGEYDGSNYLDDFFAI